ncbi:MAG: ABC transporter ATP-binding protein [Lachnospiraceae bacterium]|nr:ABC transporter ATP-binding protein [Lachnospiraceae bacterium]
MQEADNKTENSIEEAGANQQESRTYIRCEGLVRIYKSEGVEVMALQGLDLRIDQGELVAIIGKSGSGKSTLLNLLGGLDKPSAGAVYFHDDNLAEMNERQLAAYRNKHIGFVWQKISDNLLFYLTAAENVELPLLYTKMSRKEKRERAISMLAAVGLEHKADAYPEQLSGGEQQRVAIATALINEPELLLMDEPTGAVDKKTSHLLQDLFKKLNRELGITVVIVTHDISLADRVDRVVMISDGKISSERILKEAESADANNLSEAAQDTAEGSVQEGNVESAVAGEILTHEEFSILDRAGRVALSAEMRKAAGITTDRVKIDIEDGRIVITAPD